MKAAFTAVWLYSVYLKLTMQLSRQFEMKLLKTSYAAAHDHAHELIVKFREEIDAEVVEPTAP